MRNHHCENVPFEGSALRTIFFAGVRLIGMLVAFLIVGSAFSKTSAQVTISLTSGSNPSCLNSSVTFTATANPATTTGTINFYDGVTQIGWAPLSSGIAVLTYSGLTAGSHNITASYFDGTTTFTSPVLTQTVNAYGPLVAGTFTTTAVTACANYDPAAFALTSPSGGLAPYTYQWQLNGSDIPGATGSTYDPSNLLTPGAYVYQAVIKDACGNQVTTASKTITIVADPTVTIPSVGPVCVGVSATLTANVTNGTGTIGYQWQSGPSLSGPWANIPGGTSATYAAPTSPANTYFYKVLVTVNGSACNNANAATQLLVNPIPATPSASGNSPVCVGSPLNLSTPAVAGATYSWTGPNGFTSALQNPSIAFVTPAAAGTYSVTITVNGCTSAAGTVNVVVNALPVATISAGGPTSFCQGSSVVLTSSAASGNVWSTGSTNQSIIVNTSGSYSVTVTDANGCSATSAVTTVTVNPLPTIFNVTGGGAYCAGGSGVAIGLSGSQSGISYQLKNGATDIGSPVAGTGGAISFGNITAAGTYTVVATNLSTSCSANMTGNAVVTINPLPTVFNVTGGGVYCAGGSGMSVGLSGSQTGVNYQLQLNNVNTGSPVAGTGGGISFGNQTAAGNYTVVATSTATPACSSSMNGTAVVSINPLPVATATPSSQTICSGTATNIALSSSVAGTTYAWTVFSQTGASGATAGSGNNIIQTLSATGTAAGTVTYSIIPTANGCPGTSITVTVTVSPTPTVNAITNQVYCNNASGGAVNFSSGVAGATFAWTSTANIGFGTSGSGNISAYTAANATNAPIVATISVIATANGCAGPAITFTITVNPTPSVNAVANQILCTNTSTTDKL